MTNKSNQYSVKGINNTSNKTNPIHNPMFRRNINPWTKLAPGHQYKTNSNKLNKKYSK